MSHKSAYPITCSVVWMAGESNDVKHRNFRYNPARIIWKVRQYIDTIGRSNIAHRVNRKGDKFLAASMGFRDTSQHNLKAIKVTWNKPERGWIKINTDGASKGNPGLAGAGGIARDEKGMAIFAYYEFIGEATNMYAVVYGIFQALQLCQTENISRIWIEVDAVNLIRLIKEPSKGHWSLQRCIPRLEEDQTAYALLLFWFLPAVDTTEFFTSDATIPRCNYQYIHLVSFCYCCCCNIVLLLLMILLRFATAAAVILFCCFVSWQQPHGSHSCAAVAVAAAAAFNLLLLLLRFATDAATFGCCCCCSFAWWLQPHGLTRSLAKKGKRLHNHGLVISSVKTNSREETSDHDQGWNLVRSTLHILDT
ncbi:UNVERIFIED_CONTAM: putative ribonuclease H protein [Sesamum radiatum]|uniref:Ribonuclease H protein n=1 Tax=Sesamum radiatum TaxID=300843 RepID=A0AAW2KR43_SESRA